MQQGHLTTELLSAYLDTQVSEEERSTVEGHVSTCGTCAATLDSLQRTVAMLRAVPSPPLPRSFAIGPRPVRASVVPLFGQPYLLRALSGLAAAAMVVVLLVDAVGPGAMRTTQQLAAPAAMIEPSSDAVRERDVAPASRAEGRAALRQDGAADAADTLGAERSAGPPVVGGSMPSAERPAGTPAAVGGVMPPAAPMSGLRAGEAAAPASDETFTASRAAPSPAAEEPVRRLSDGEGATSQRNFQTLPPRDEPAASSSELRALTPQQSSPSPAFPWSRAAAVALGLLALGLGALSFRPRRRLG